MKSTREGDIESRLPKPGEASWMEIVRRQVGSLRFGVVQIVVHGAQVVQIDRTERIRLSDLVALSTQTD